MLFGERAAGQVFPISAGFQFDSDHAHAQRGPFLNADPQAVEQSQVRRHLEALRGRSGRDALKTEVAHVFHVAEPDIAELRDFFVSVCARMNRGRGLERDVDGLAGRTARSLEVDEFPFREPGDIVGQHSGEVEVEVFALFRADGATRVQFAESGNRSEHPLSFLPSRAGGAGKGAQPRFGYNQQSKRAPIERAGGQSSGAGGVFKISRLSTRSHQTAIA